MCFWLTKNPVCYPDIKTFTLIQIAVCTNILCYNLTWLSFTVTLQYWIWIIIKKYQWNYLSRLWYIIIPNNLITILLTLSVEKHVYFVQTITPGTGYNICTKHKTRTGYNICTKHNNTRTGYNICTKHNKTRTGYNICTKHNNTIITVWNICRILA